MSPTGLTALHKEIGFTQIRFYCHKSVPGITIHIMTNLNSYGKKVVEFMTSLEISIRPGSCNSYTTLPDDNSILNQCDLWLEEKWSGKPENLNHVYERIYYFGTPTQSLNPLVYHECGDRGYNSAKGQWLFYVR